MTTTRLQLLMKKAEPSYAPESPLLLMAYALYRDTETNENVAQLKWQNLDARSVKAVMVVLITYDAFEQRLDDIQYQYDGLSATTRKEFGSKLPIIIHDSRVSRFDAVLRAVSFVDGNVWRSDEGNIFKPLPKPVEQTLTGDLFSQLKRDMKNKPWITKYTMQTMHDIWQCGCGNWQKDGMPCSKCHITQEKLISATDPALLQEHLTEYKAEVERLRVERQKQAEEAHIERKKQEEEARILREQREAELAQQKAQQKALQKRRAIISGIVAAVVVALVAFVLVTQVLPSRKYNQAQALYDAQDYEAAYQLYASLSGYKDADSKLKACESIIIDTKFVIGNYVKFGTYPQTAEGTDNTPIEWLVLDQDGSKALLISRYGLDAQPYNTQNASVTWETCTLRTWLNSTFLNKAFSAEEQAAILITAVGNIKSQGYSTWNTDGGNNTQDKVFLLSYAEAKKYFGVEHCSNSGANGNTKARVKPTAYAEKQGAYTDNLYKTAVGDSTGIWWLRSPGYHQYYAAYVLADGSLFYNDVNNDNGCVRPAIWIDLDSGAVLISDNP